MSGNTELKLEKVVSAYQRLVLHFLHGQPNQDIGRAEPYVNALRIINEEFETNYMDVGLAKLTVKRFDDLKLPLMEE